MQLVSALMTTIYSHLLALCSLPRGRCLSGWPDIWVPVYPPILTGFEPGLRKQNCSISLLIWCMPFLFQFFTVEGALWASADVYGNNKLQKTRVGRHWLWKSKSLKLHLTQLFCALPTFGWPSKILVWVPCIMSAESSNTRLKEYADWYLQNALPLQSPFAAECLAILFSFFELG